MSTPVEQHESRAVPWLFVGLLLYFLLLAWLRTAAVAGGSVDDAEQLLYSQSYAWSYATDNPGLLTWVIHSLQYVTSATLASVTLPKFTMLAASYLVLLACARRVLADDGRAVACTVSMAGIYYVVWESVLSYSHSVQILLVCLLTLALFLHMRDTRRRREYVALGVLIAVGVLTKFNYVVFLSALVAACLSVAPYRAIACDRRFVASLLSAAALLLPVLAGHHARLTAHPGAVQDKFEMAAHWSTGVAAQGLVSTFTALLSWLAPLLVFVLLVMPRVFLPLKAGNDSKRIDDERWLRAFGLWLVAIMLVLTVASRATYVRAHYFQIAVPLVLWVAVRAQLAAIPLKRVGVVAGLSLLMALLVPALLALDLAGAISLYPSKPRLHLPYAQLARELSARGFVDGTVVACDWPHALSGNLRPYFPQSRFVSYHHPLYRPPLREQGGQCLLLWQPEHRQVLAPQMEAFAQHLRVSHLEPARTGEIVLPLSSQPGHTATVAYRLIAHGEGDCQ